MRLLLVLIALAMIVEFSSGGRLTGAELLMIPFAIKALAQGKSDLPSIRHFYILAGLWFIGAISSDLINQSTFEDAVRGQAKIIFFVLNVTALRSLVGTDRSRAVLLIFALAVASSLRLALGLNGDELAEDPLGNAWKFGYGQLFSMASLLVSAYALRSVWLRPFSSLPPFAAAFIALMLNARNLTGLTALAGLVVAFIGGRRRPLSTPYLLTILAAALVVGMTVVNLYKYTASEGLLGREAQDKYIAQNEGKLNFLLAGRTESLASTQAIIDAPIFGHGSWAHDIDYVFLMLSRMEEAGLQVNWMNVQSDLIPTHSHLLGAWVEHGILGATFWFWALYITIKGILAAVRRPDPLAGFVVFIGISLLWDIPFSPFGLERRMVTAVWLYLMILYADRGKATAPASPKVITNKFFTASKVKGH
ncbi:hypothetical protein J2858_003468 [Neorhizobium galegae]|uniref:O-antigen ligase family protein n=1 Tax=Neorhizobium galegae TaxID=399 RepID=UPI001AE80047|nr:O-antigen ligase family protein [Neorhizobium galegae]MBP2550528.1 hypothetical protein [Neorhizobium galegae]